ncbi:COG4648 family protein [Kozakia baliensis]|uniref:Uncharacterized protein n=1 Tax=Kozakia baliensis TaxID=153496 RepID=A0A1D8UR50_9PROT|nr:hypothetical protein [Kozakia baliensis]AOX16132.1 hypothetical protein A0U89_02225 [Kozakia baliensis]
MLPYRRHPAKRAFAARWGVGLFAVGWMLPRIWPSAPYAAAGMALFQIAGLGLLSALPPWLYVPVAALLAVAATHAPALSRIIDAAALYTAALLTPLAIFATSLRAGREPIITHVARQVHGVLRPDVARYTRALTWFWCVFFVVALVSPALLWWQAPAGWWRTPMNGGVLLAVAIVFIVEYGVRRMVIRNFHHVGLIESVQAFRRHSG